MCLNSTRVWFYESPRNGLEEITPNRVGGIFCPIPFQVDNELSSSRLPIACGITYKRKITSIV